MSVSLRDGVLGRIRNSRARAATFYGLCRSACITLALRTHVRKWQQVAQSGPPTWDVRNAIIARFIPAGSSVLDLGSGAQTLRAHLQPGCTYQPCDVVKSSPDVILCDFNRGIYPDPGRRLDYVVCSGVLEYVRKPREFLKRVPAMADTMILSYNPRMKGESKLQRLAKHWVNHLRQEALEKMLDDLGLTWKIINRREPNEIMYSIQQGPR
jgi:Methionine biosynthesis protein MetW